MRFFQILAIICISITLLGCASTKVATSGSVLKKPLCQAGTDEISALVFWTPQWRPDQKEPQLREAAALRGIQHFFSDSPCVTNVDIRRLPNGASEDVPSDEEILRTVTTAALEPDRILLVVVRELGPRLVIGIPMLVAGGTEVIVDVRVLNAKTSESLANVRTHWQNGGTFVIKGVKTLDQDMSAALRTILVPTAVSP
jgi:hypothetical protein